MSIYKSKPLDLHILDKLACFTAENKQVKAKELAKLIGDPFHQFTTRQISARLEVLGREGYVVRESDWSSDYNVGYWSITMQGCEYLFVKVARLTIYEDARANAIDADDFIVFKYNEQVQKYITQLPADQYPTTEEVEDRASGF